MLAAWTASLRLKDAAVGRVTEEEEPDTMRLELSAGVLGWSSSRNVRCFWLCSNSSASPALRVDGVTELPREQMLLLLRLRLTLTFSIQR